MTARARGMHTLDRLLYRSERARERKTHTRTHSPVCLTAERESVRECGRECARGQNAHTSERELDIRTCQSVVPLRESEGE